MFSVWEPNNLDSSGRFRICDVGVFKLTSNIDTLIRTF